MSMNHLCEATVLHRLSMNTKLMARIKPLGITEAGCFAMIFISGASDTGSGFRQTEALKGLATVSQSFLIASNSNYTEPQRVSLLQGTRKPGAGFLISDTTEGEHNSGFLPVFLAFIYLPTHLLNYLFICVDVEVEGQLW